MQVLGLKSGRKWSVDAVQDDAGTYVGEGAIDSATEEYIIKREASDVTWTSGDVRPFQSLSGLPKVGDPHNGNSKSLLRVSRVEFSEGTGSDKMFITATVTYSRAANEVQDSGGETSIDIYCESWGWTNGSVQRDAMSSDGKPIVNSAGDPFDSAPQIDHPAPIFHKVFKTRSRMSDVVSLHNKVNDGDITISGQKFPKDTLRVVQAEEERIFNDASGFKYRYSIGLQYLSNEQNVFAKDANGDWQSQGKIEIGWQLGVADMGTRSYEYPPEGGGVKVWMRIMDQMEDGTYAPVSMPVALDGHGHRDSSGEPAILLYEPYLRTEIPEILYSEPA